MKSDTPPLEPRDRVVIVGAGIAGLATALRLAHAGLAVTVLERHAGPGGKMRALPSEAGPVDAGPTVLTMRGVFDALFASVGARLEDHIDLVPQDILARHFWPDGSHLDLFADEAQSRAAIHGFAGDRAARQFTRFCARARRLFTAFDSPMMQAAAPSSLALAATVARQPTLIRAMAPLSTLAQSLSRQFDDPRLRQLFGRYATYVGGSPYQSPALLSLIWQAEAAGVWVVRGGMHRLAQSLATLASAHGAQFHYGTHVARIETEGPQVRGVTLGDGTRLAADFIVFNGDPRALASGLLGPAATAVAPPDNETAAQPLGAGLGLCRHALRSRPGTSQRIFRRRCPQRIRRSARRALPTRPHSLCLRSGSRPTRTAAPPRAVRDHSQRATA
ncbi:phytoene desaturase family protein [Roseovarius mucosus]